jgi:hypothetical protein
MTEIDSPPVRAPDFPANLDWIHTGGRRLTLADFRGKLLFLDFWTVLHGRTIGRRRVSGA